MSALVLFVLSLFGYILAKTSDEKNNKQNNAIIYASSVNVKSEPNADGTELFILHEGTRVRIIETTTDWSYIQLPNGNKGWVKQEDIKTI